MRVLWVRLIKKWGKILSKKLQEKDKWTVGQKTGSNDGEQVEIRYAQPVQVKIIKIK